MEISILNVIRNSLYTNLMLDCFELYNQQFDEYQPALELFKHEYFISNNYFKFTTEDLERVSTQYIIDNIITCKNAINVKVKTVIEVLLDELEYFKIFSVGSNYYTLANQIFNGTSSLSPEATNAAKELVNYQLNYPITTYELEILFPEYPMINNGDYSIKLEIRKIPPELYASLMLRENLK